MIEEKLKAKSTEAMVYGKIVKSDTSITMQKQTVIKLTDAIAICQQEIDEACKLKWISVKDRLPEKGQQVLAYNPTDKEEPFWVDYLFLNANKELRWDMGVNEVTHWMPLPESPKENT